MGTLILVILGFLLGVAFCFLVQSRGNLRGSALWVTAFSAIAAFGSCVAAYQANEIARRPYLKDVRAYITFHEADYPSIRPTSDWKHGQSITVTNVGNRPILIESLQLSAVKFFDRGPEVALPIEFRLSRGDSLPFMVGPGKLANWVAEILAGLPGRSEKLTLDLVCVVGSVDDEGRAYTARFRLGKLSPSLSRFIPAQDNQGNLTVNDRPIPLLNTMKGADPEQFKRGVLTRGAAKLPDK